MPLSIDGKAVPLLLTSVTADIVDNDATVLLFQDFANPAFGRKGETQEAVYEFPLQSNSAVYYFRSTFRSSEGEILKSLVGKAVEKQAAREEYEQAKANGQSAQLLEQNFENSPDIFTLSVGSIPPEAKNVQVEIGYYLALFEEQKGTVNRFLLPAAVAGRYGKSTGNGWKKNNVAAGATLFEVSVNVSLSDTISLIESPSHKVKTELFVDGSPSKAYISFALKSEFLSTDFVLKISGNGAPRSSVLIQDPSSIRNDQFLKSFGDATVGKFTFQCLATAEEEIIGATKQNFVFVVDRSGSMSGSSMENCKKALLLCLSCLPENCVFNICSFGSSHSFLFQKSEEYSAETLNKARAHVKSMEANMGGTEILNPIKETIEKKESEFPTIIFLLTDGEVYNTEQVVQTIRNTHNQHGTRVFSCGIGSGVSTHLVEGLAKAGGGSATFISHGEKMNAKLSAQMEQAMYPAYEDLSVDTGDLRLCGADLASDINESVPKFALNGQKLSFYGVLETGSLIEIEKRLASGEKIKPIQLFGTQKLEEETQKLMIGEIDINKEFLKSSCNLIVPALRAHVQKCEEQEIFKKTGQLRALQLSICANVVSKFTSLVAVEELPDGSLEYEEAKHAEIRRKSELMDRAGFLPPSAASMSLFPSLPRLSLPSPGKFLGSVKAARRKKPKKGIAKKLTAQENQLRSTSAYLNKKATISDGSVEKKTMTAQPLTHDQKLATLIDLQNPDGSFESSVDLANLVGKKDLGLNESTLGFATAVAIIFMENQLSDLRAEWKLLAKKATKYLKKNVTDYDDLLELARNFI